MSERRSRKEHRLANYDYSQNGAYFVTICTKNMVHYFWDENNITPLSNANSDKLTHSVYGSGIVLRVDGDLINIAFKDPAYGVKTLLGKHGSLSKV